MLGLLGLRIFEATGADITDLGEEHGHRVLRVCGKGTRVVLVPLPPPVGRASDIATGARASGPILLNNRGTRMDHHAATRTTSWPLTWPPAPDRACSSPRPRPGTLGIAESSAPTDNDLQARRLWHQPPPIFMITEPGQ